jgi:hypothetical protein
MYNQFKMAAQAISGTPSPVVSVALTGSGAFATAAPSTAVVSSALSSVISTSPPVSSASSISTSTPTSTSTSTTSTASSVGTTNASKSHLGAIIGGVIGGLVGGLFIIGALVWCLRHRKSKKRRDSASTDDARFFRYNVPVRTPSDAFRSAKANENLRYNGGTPPQTNENPVTRDPSPDLARPLSPLRRGQFTTPAPISLALPTAPPINPPATANDSAPTNAGAVSGGQVSNLDMQALANEVAQVLIRSTSANTLNAQRRAANESAGTYTRPQSMRIANPSANDPPTTDLLDPPAYRRQAGTNSPLAQKANLPRD